MTAAYGKGHRNPIVFFGDPYGTKGPDGRVTLYATQPHLLAVDPAVSASAYRVAGYVYAQSEAWEVSINSIAEGTSLGVRAVRNGMNELVSMRWFAREALGDNRYRLYAARHEPLPHGTWSKLNTYCPSSTRGGAPTQQGVVPPRQDNSVEASVKTSNSLKTSVEQMIPPEWAPNIQHRRTAAKYSIDIIALAEDFMRGATESRAQRSDWDRAFGKILSEIIEGSLRTSDFFGIAEHICEEPDAYYVGEVDPGVIGVVSGGR